MSEGSYCRVRTTSVVPQESDDPRELTACFVLYPHPDRDWQALFVESIHGQPFRLAGDRVYVQGRNRIDLEPLLELVDRVNELVDRVNERRAQSDRVAL